MSNNLMLIYCFVAMAAGAIFWYIPRAKKKLKEKAVDLVYYFDGFPMVEPTPVSDAKLRQLLVGSILSFQNDTPLNTLSTALEKDSINTILQGWWDIHSREDALETLDRLLNRGFRFHFTVVSEAFRASKKKREQIILDGFNKSSDSYHDDVERATHQVAMLDEAWNDLVDRDVVFYKKDINFYGALGWDMGRLSYLTRVCYDAGHIRESEAWQYLERSYQLASAEYENWFQFSQSYIIGRAMWGGLQESTPLVVNLSKQLLNEDDSPWLSHPLK